LEKLLNAISITGNLVAALEDGLRSTTNSQVARRAIAENLGKDKDAQFVDMEAWGPVATQLQNLPKGAYVTGTGFLKINKYKTKDGQNRTKAVIVLKSIALAERTAKKDDASTAASTTAAASTNAAADPESEEVVF
jgi:single-stranded DNA-binding protein